VAELLGAVSGHRDFIVKLAVQYGLLAVYGHRTWVDRGGLISYGPDLLAISRLAAGYVEPQMLSSNRLFRL
jgi:putative tryptophan/tyrosine transport system substrate-binding protein